MSTKSVDEGEIGPMLVQRRIGLGFCGTVLVGVLLCAGYLVSRVSRVASGAKASTFSAKVAPPSQAAPAPALASPDARVAALEARCQDLARDVHAIALFARTLLTLLEAKQVVTEAQFVETRRRLDAIDAQPVGGVTSAT